jgi:glucose-6-phosphate isomerase
MWSTPSCVFTHEVQRMTTPGPHTPAWATLQRLAAQGAGADVRGAFTQDPDRTPRYSRSAAGVLLDLSHERIDHEVLAALIELLEQVKIREGLAAMWAGEPINSIEQRAALHVALRQPKGARIGGPEIEAEVLAERERMLAFAEWVRSSGRYDRLVNLGIGGSDLGPAMAVQALKAFAALNVKVDFVSNVDGCALHDVLESAEPARTLFIVCSKTFTTQETLANAETARQWVASNLGDERIPEHFAAVSVNAQAMDAFGIQPDRRFKLWDWVGGRYSVWSSVGLALAIAIGGKNFEEFLAGAYAMDEHARTAPFESHLPALLAAVGVWNSNFLGIPTVAVLPYTDRLARFPAFLQQLEMESNGKSVTRAGEPVVWPTAPVVWGEPGNNAQHSFFQMLHQGTLRAALEFIVVRHSPVGNAAQQALANANALAQIESFTVGQGGDDPHRRHEGNRPLAVLRLEQLTPQTLGALIALYEHKVYVQSQLWGINAFDQFGVELGKKNCLRLGTTTAGLQQALAG